jgi:hypothetical protein
MAFYTVIFEAVAVTAAQDFFEIAPADDKPCRIAGLMLSQSSDIADAAEELLRVTITRVPTHTSGSGGTGPTPRLIASSGTAAGFAAEVNNTTVATTAGTLEHILAYQFNVRTGLELFLPPEFQPVCVQASALVVRLAAAPTDSLTMSGCLFVEELY